METGAEGSADPQPSQRLTELQRRAALGACLQVCPPGGLLSLLE